jgi:glycosyltransferase involved in cell wall biosynthesis
MKTILATVYSLNPYKGSEEAMGWNYVYQAARFHKVIAITRENNQAAVEQYMAENPDAVYDNITFVYFDLPYWMRFWKKGGRGVILYYLLWQYALPAFIKKQHLQFDITHNLNFHNDWSPSFLWKLNKPFVWGPIGHHPLIPAQYLKGYAVKHWIKDRFTWMVKQLFWKGVPALKQTIKQADYIWSMNTSVSAVIDIEGKKGHISPSVATQDFGWNENKVTEKFTVISAGRLVPLKGYDITILAFAQFLRSLPEALRTNCELLIVGSGPEEQYYKQLVAENNIEKRVRFISWIKRDELMVLFKQASAFMFPSHEGAGMVVPEALSFGLPVLCLDNNGPGEMINNTCGFAVPKGNYEETLTIFANHLSELFLNPMILKKMSANARKHFEAAFHWNRRGEQLVNIYNQF